MTTKVVTLQKRENVKRQQQLRPRRRQRLTETFIIPPFAISAISTGRSELWNQIYKEACMFLYLKEIGTALGQWAAIQRNNLQGKRKEDT